ncbi:hypothetical protein ACFSTD_22615 [Novosphingobium colocasiae]|uniref:Uncharacterized protein n=1 Tax=Novosphingobium colocasiae TaxID=1256513 RepID=A0A918PLH8_9SPHN|nr:hypothetical protein [Novosphingobium colocasiae]GGZ15242.1 hypothetical protein GCM10011614_32670 [Novosphingobium colocasiae]
MVTLNKIAAASLAAAIALGSVAPASAADYGHRGWGNGSAYAQSRGWDDDGYGRYDARDGNALRLRILDLRSDISMAAQRGIISRGEFVSLARQVDRLGARYTDYARDGGIGRREANDLRDRIVDLRQRLNHEARDRNDWRR